jgi:hypothetical protein
MGVLRPAQRVRSPARHADLERARNEWVAQMARAQVAEVPQLANAQQYEVPADFYRLTLGSQLKYSSAYFPAGVTRLDDAEEAPRVHPRRRRGPSTTRRTDRPP